MDLKSLNRGLYVKDFSSYPRCMGSSGACARAGSELAMGASRPTGGLEDSSMVPVSF